MNKIIKSYLKTFFKSWIESFGSIIFTVLLTIVSVGLLAPSVQVANKISNVESKSNKWDLQFDNDYNSFSSDFLFNYFYSHKNYQVNDEINLQQPNQDSGFFTPLFYRSLHHQIGEVDSDTPISMENLKSSSFTAILNNTMGILRSCRDGLKIETSIQHFQEDRNLTYGEILSADFQKQIGSESDNFASVQLFLQKQLYIRDELKDKMKISFNPSMCFEERPILNSKGRVIETRRISDKNSEQLGNVVVSSGRLPEFNVTKPEVMITDLYAKKNHISIGDQIKLPYGFKDNKMFDIDYEVVGFGSTIESLSPGENYYSNWKNSSNYFFAYLNSKDFDSIYFNFWENQSQKIHNLNNVSLIKKQDKSFSVESQYSDSNGENPIWINVNDVLIKFNDNWYVINNILSKIEAILFIIIAIVVLTLAFLFINFLINKEINDSLRQLGIFKASGYSNLQLAWVFVIKVWITLFVGILVGYLISLPVQGLVLQVFASQILFYVQPIYYSFWFLTLLFIVIPAVFSLLSYCLICNFLNRPTMELINNTARIKELKKGQKIWSYIIFPVFLTQLISSKINQILYQKGIGFNYRLRAAFTQRSRGKFLVTISLFSISSLLFLFQMGSKDLISQNYNRYTNPYNQNLDHFYQFDSQPNIIWNNQTGYQLEDEESYLKNKIEFIGYDSKNFGQVIDENSDDFQEKISLITEMTLNSILKDSHNLLSDEMIIKGLSTEPWENIGTSIEKLLKADITKLKDSDKFENIPLITNESDLEKTIMFYTNKKIDNKSSNFKLKDFKTIFMLMYYQNSTIKQANEIYQKLTNKGLSQELAIKLIRNGIDESIKNYQNIFTRDISRNAFKIQVNNEMMDIQSNNISQKSRILLAAAFSSENNSETIVTDNKIFYNQKYENLSYSMGVKPLFQKDLPLNNLELVDFENQYGDFQNSWRIRLTNSNNLNKMKNSGYDNIYETKVIISKLFAMKYNLSVGDTFLAAPRTSPGFTGIVRLKVVDINLANTYTDTMFADYDTFFEVNSQGVLNPNSENSVVIKNRLYSQKEIYKGNIDNADLSQTFLNINLTTDTIAINSKLDAPILGFWFKDIIDLDKLFGVENSIFKEPDLLTNPSLTEKILNSRMSYLRLTRDFAKTQMSQINSMMTIFMVLNSLLLVILFIVIMSIVIDSSRNIITVMKAFGYKDWEVNWIVMGNYVIYSIIAFLISYIFSLIVWKIVISISWSSSKVLMEFPWSFWAPLITFSALSLVGFFGWLTANLKVRKEPIVNVLN
ncbi:ABC transporter permease [Spiroplasma endosymbiont of Panorpa germanica]|uniref:ABC transporter permease n=1 Tax=Spiroplasma endosymbiont of Panorpa germanica TaxID=3066314 RepID=UPI0030CA6CE3